jgi:ABC-type lipoprotein export system ATPase subunit
MSKIAIKLKNVKKEYIAHDNKITIFNDLNLEFEYGKLYGIIGHSGCGKSTLIKMIGLIENLSGGEITIDGVDTSALDDKELALLRNKKLGFVFQDYLLDDSLNVIDNVLLPVYADKNINESEKREYAKKLLEKYKLDGRIKHYTLELSGGEQQRVSICRALINNPNIILADEPTGNLDKKTEKIILDDLKELSKEGKCVLIVSHSDVIKDYADEIVDLESVVGDDI